MEAILRGEGPYIGQRDILLIIRSVGFLGFLWFSFTNLVVIKIFGCANWGFYQDSIVIR